MSDDTNRNIMISAFISPEDRLALDGIAELDGGTSMAATLRRLIRDEARRRNLNGEPQQPEDARNEV